MEEGEISEEDKLAKRKKERQDAEIEQKVGLFDQHISKDKCFVHFCPENVSLPTLT